MGESVTPNPEAAAQPPATLRRRLGNVALGAASGGAAGWLCALFGGVHGAWSWSAIGALAAMGAAFGYRYGRAVVLAAMRAITEAT